MKYAPAAAAISNEYRPNDQKTVVLEFDETLIHRVDATWPIQPENYEDSVAFRFSKGERRVTCILKRQYVDELLQFLSNNNLEIVVITTAGEEYVLDNRKGLIRHHCKIVVKDLSSVLGRDDVKQANAEKLLPPLELKYPTSRMMKTVVLDLDETLIHNVKGTGGDPPKIYDFLFQMDKRVYYILKRPFVDEFLQCLSKNNFEIVVFTAATERYASRVLDFLDPSGGLIKHRLYRDSCYEVNVGRIKSLSLLGRDLRKVVIVDDNPISYIFNRENAIPIKPFIDDRIGELDGLFSRILQEV